MKHTLGILNWIKANKLLTAFIAAFGLVSALLIINAKGKATIKCEDCQPFKEQNKELISALIDIKKDLVSVQSTSFNQLQPELIMFASYDTIPKRKIQQSQMQKVQQRVINKIDSLILRYRVKQDSLTQKRKT